MIKTLLDYSKTFIDKVITRLSFSLNGENSDGNEWYFIHNRLSIECVLTRDELTNTYHLALYIPMNEYSTLSYWENDYPANKQSIGLMRNDIIKICEEWKENVIPIHSLIVSLVSLLESDLDNKTRYDVITTIREALERVGF